MDITQWAGWPIRSAGKIMAGWSFFDRIRTVVWPRSLTVIALSRGIREAIIKCYKGLSEQRTEKFLEAILCLKMCFWSANGERSELENPITILVMQLIFTRPNRSWRLATIFFFSVNRCPTISLVKFPVSNLFEQCNKLIFNETGLLSECMPFVKHLRRQKKEGKCLYFFKVHVWFPAKTVRWKK